MAIVKKTIEQLPQNESPLTGETLFEVSIDGVSYKDSLANIQNYLFFVPAKAYITTTPTYFSVGKSTSIAVRCTIDPGDETTFNSRELYKGTNLLTTYSTLDFTYNDTLLNTTPTTTQYRNLVDVNNNGVDTTLVASNSVYSVYPMLWATTSNILDGSTLYAASTKILRPKENTTLTLSGSGVYSYFAYDSSYPDLLAVLDPNGFNIISGYAKTLVNVVSSGLDSNWTKEYKMYKFNTISEFNGQYKFLFTL